MADIDSVEKLQLFLKEKEAQYLDLRFTDILGTTHHVTVSAGLVDRALFENGFAFDGSSITGWKSIEESDMLLFPDPSTVHMDPFASEAMAAVTCDVVDPVKQELYNRSPRTVAKKALEALQASGIGDAAFFGPELEFFVFDDVRFATEPNEMFFTFDSEELPSSSGRDIEGGNLGHRPRTKGGYFPQPPVDQSHDMRSEMTSTLNSVGIHSEKHHHEVGPAQHELGFTFGDLIGISDQVQLYKYVIRMVAHSYGKTATFMPKPMFGDNGSGMHVHQSLWKKGTNIFAGDAYAGLSQTCLYYIGGIIKHGRAINAFANPTTNSYKRLVPGYEAPVILVYSYRNRSAACRVPHSTEEKARRIEIRFPDPLANPYLAFSAMLLAGLDGIINKIDPGAAHEADLYALSEQEQAGLPTVCASLEEAIEALSADREFLKRGGAFDDDLIDAFIALKREECDRLRMTPHPVEFDLYYSK